MLRFPNRTEALLFDHTLFVHLVALAGSKKEIRFEAVLPHVQVVIAAAKREERRMVAAFDDAPAFDNQNLVSAANRGEPMGDDERRASLHQLGQAALDHLLGFGVE